MIADCKDMKVRPLYIKVHESDNVAIIVNTHGLPAGSEFPCGLVLREAVPEGHKLALRDLAQDEPILRYGEIIGYAVRADRQRIVDRGVAGAHAGGAAAREPAAGDPGAAGVAAARGLHLRRLP